MKEAWYAIAVILSPSVIKNPSFLMMLATHSLSMSYFILDGWYTWLSYWQRLLLKLTKLNI